MSALQSTNYFDGPIGVDHEQAAKLIKTAADFERMALQFVKQRSAIVSRFGRELWLMHKWKDVKAHLRANEKNPPQQQSLFEPSTWTEAFVLEHFGLPLKHLQQTICNAGKNKFRSSDVISFNHAAQALALCHAFSNADFVKRIKDSWQAVEEARVQRAAVVADGADGDGQQDDSVGLAVDAAGDVNDGGGDDGIGRKVAVEKEVVEDKEKDQGAEREDADSPRRRSARATQEQLENVERAAQIAVGSVVKIQGVGHVRTRAHDATKDPGIRVVVGTVLFNCGCCCSSCG
eukprot:TRINITY_DN65691_c0_g1_i2.p1 TRINITY_DN65691_c0_g1~~TRINITY_DN65691_c0_g1_i2.p1  ORF type:complete len:302 (-),score=93.82 TRINITY_DN65691_c0_g1_i2:633-1502(-)